MQNNMKKNKIKIYMGQARVIFNGENIIYIIFSGNIQWEWKGEGKRIR